MKIDPETIPEETLERIEEAISEFREGMFVREEEIDKFLGL